MTDEVSRELTAVTYSDVISIFIHATLPCNIRLYPPLFGLSGLSGFPRPITDSPPTLTTSSGLPESMYHGWALIMYPMHMLLLDREVTCGSVKVGYSRGCKQHRFRDKAMGVGGHR